MESLPANRKDRSRLSVDLARRECSRPHPEERTEALHVSSGTAVTPESCKLINRIAYYEGHIGTTTPSQLSVDIRTDDMNSRASRLMMHDKS